VHVCLGAVRRHTTQVTHQVRSGPGKHGKTTTVHIFISHLFIFKLLIYYLLVCYFLLIIYYQVNYLYTMHSFTIILYYKAKCACVFFISIIFLCRKIGNPTSGTLSFRVCLIVFNHSLYCTYYVFCFILEAIDTWLWLCSYILSFPSYKYLNF